MTPSREPSDPAGVHGSVTSSERPADDLAEPGQTHTVRPGDTLAQIAVAYYGHAGLRQRIFEANRDVLDDPDRIRPGQVLKIPAVGPHSGPGHAPPKTGG